jgi:hypothetical protein
MLHIVTARVSSISKIIPLAFQQIDFIYELAPRASIRQDKRGAGLEKFETYSVDPQKQIRVKLFSIFGNEICEHTDLFCISLNS